MIEYALTSPQAMKSLVLSNTCADMPHLIEELDRLRASLGPETVAMIQRHEAMDTLKHPAYEAATTTLNYRHVLRLDEWPEPVRASLGDWNMDVSGPMQGPNESSIPAISRTGIAFQICKAITVPTLILCGHHDELPPSCSMRMHQALRNSEIAVFPNSSHMPFYEEPEAYFARLRQFLAARR